MLEHQYWDLNAFAEEFEVTLKFGGVPKYVKVPYTAVSRFHDPSVGFALQFDPPEEMEPAAPTLAHLNKTDAKPAAKPKAIKKTKPAAKTKASKKDGDEKASDNAEENVVSLDAFRKK